nr:sulfatase-like hydrolase/transferase [Deltaproteobacteria bacterium]
MAAHVTRTFHSRSLMVAPIALAVPVAVALAAVATVVASWPLAPLVRRAGRFASVGAVVIATATAALIPLARAVAHHRDALGALDLRGLVLALGVFALDAALVVALLRRVGTARARRRVSAVAVAVTAACAALAAVPALGLGRRQSVLFVLANRTLVTRYAIGPLQRVLDRDRDGYGVLFGGGDCDDRDPRAYPGAPETPGNGVDESCSGRDGPSARTLRRRPRGGALAPRFERSPSVLFVSLDAVRPDRTSAYGYARPTTPNLEHFAGGAARFTSAYAVAPGSLRSFVSTFTGQYPGDVAWGAGSDPRFPSVADANVTLAESLREAGYATAAFTNTSYFSGTPGFFQGFDVVQDEPAFKDDAAPMVRHAVEWIERARDRPFFAWVHLIDAHAPYGNHRWPQDFGPSESGRYDGEGFNEHGARYHYYDVHEESIRVVLLVRGPSVEPGTRHALTALLDLHATVLDLAGRPIDGPSPARSLVPVLFSRHGGTPADWRDEVYSDVAEFGGARPSAMTLIAPPWKILFDAARNGWELYNLSLDPREERNLFDEDPTRAAELRARQLDDRAGAGRGVTRPCARKPDWGTVRAHRRRSDRA